MTVVIAALVLVVVVLAVLVAGLLRSHAAILRRLHELGAGLDLDPGLPAGDGAGARGGGGSTVPAPPRGVAEGRPAVDVTGVGPRGDAVALRVVDVAHDTLLVFLSTGCSTCASFWRDLATPDVPADTRVVVVTRDPSQDSPSTLLDLAPEGLKVVMSSRAWEDLEVPGSPFVVHVDGRSGRIVGEGTAASWDQVRALFLRSTGDGALGAPKVGADRRREQALDRLLLESGIAPGDASLYGTAPSRESDADRAEGSVPDGGHPSDGPRVRS